MKEKDGFWKEQKRKLLPLKKQSNGELKLAEAAFCEGVLLMIAKAAADDEEWRNGFLVRSAFLSNQVRTFLSPLIINSRVQRGGQRQALFLYVLQF